MSEVSAILNFFIAFGVVTAGGLLLILYRAGRTYQARINHYLRQGMNEEAAHRRAYEDLSKE